MGKEEGKREGYDQAYHEGFWNGRQEEKRQAGVRRGDKKQWVHGVHVCIYRLRRFSFVVDRFLHVRGICIRTRGAHSCIVAAPCEFPEGAYGGGIPAGWGHRTGMKEADKGKANAIIPADRRQLQRQPDESEQAHTARIAYCQLDPGKRTPASGPLWQHIGA